MKTVLVTTTINVPTILGRYRATGPSVDIIVAGDKKTPHAETVELCDFLDIEYLSPSTQMALGYECSDIIGWNTASRRNIAALEALRGGADAVITTDDDNAPVDGEFFATHRGLIGIGEWIAARPSQGVAGWLNVGQFADDPYHARGLPMSERRTQTVLRTNVGGVPVGIANGLTLGDPDMDAIGRLDRQRDVTAYRLPCDRNITISPRDTWAPLNAQNTSYRRELAPLMAVLPGVGRYDDIWGSYIAMRVLMETDWHVSFGAPYVRHERDRYPHDLWRDLDNERYGLQHTERFVADLKAIDLSFGEGILDKLALVYDGIARLDYVPDVVAAFGAAWVRDMESVL